MIWGRGCSIKENSGPKSCNSSDTGHLDLTTYFPSGSEIYQKVAAIAAGMPASHRHRGIFCKVQVINPLLRKENWGSKKQSKSFTVPELGKHQGQAVPLALNLRHPLQNFLFHGKANIDDLDNDDEDEDEDDKERSTHCVLPGRNRWNTWPVLCSLWIHQLWRRTSRTGPPTHPLGHKMLLWYLNSAPQSSCGLVYFERKRNDQRKTSAFMRWESTNRPPSSFLNGSARIPLHQVVFPNHLI